MRESFVFHADFICDLPQQYEADFAMYAINYALYGKQPPLEVETLEYSLWKKIERRINAEREKYEEVSEKRRAAAQRRYERTQAENGAAENAQEANDAGINRAEQAEANAEQKERPRADEKARKEKPAQKRFEAPSIEQVKAYCEEKGYSVNAEHFINYYESNGWRVGRNPMKNWRAAAANWAHNGYNDTAARKPPGALLGNESEISDVYMDLL